jgi:hypothetical protein
MADPKNIGEIKDYMDTLFGQVDKSRMIARLVDNQGVDIWMTFELMEAALGNVINAAPFCAGVTLLDNMCRDRQTSTTAEILNLAGSEVDKYYNFQSIRVGTRRGAAKIRHQNRPDGMFNLKLPSTEMVIFYEGDAHEKDAGKTETKGCKNAHKMYQYMAQAQSKDRLSSGCAVFAAMNDSPTEEFVQFIEDMFKAHMLVCMLIIQHNLNRKKSSNTILEDLLAIDARKNCMYDFVFGINIKAIPGNEQFNMKHFDDRVDLMLKELDKTLDIEIKLPGFDKFPQIELQTWNYTVGCLEITCIAVPRAVDEVITRNSADRRPPFIYPMHLSKITNWTGEEGTATADPNNWLLDVHEKAHPNNNMTLHFRKSMMKVTQVLLPANARADKNTQVLASTTGFFYYALPLAYFTVEQFECLVNARLDYRWASPRYNVKKMLETFVIEMKGIPTVKVRVKMFKKQQNSLLQIICKSTAEDVDDITDEFKGFLCECCQWDYTDCEAYQNPAIFFRTLGIFSLPTAIDFACDTRNNPSVTYTSLLSTYPIGTQIVIKQCMKKLSTNQAYGYLSREKRKVKISTIAEQGDSDKDEDDSTDSLVQTVQKNIVRGLTHTSTTWVVTHKKSTDVEYDAWSTKVHEEAKWKQLQNELIKAYTKSVKKWLVKSAQFDGIPQQDATRREQGKFDAVYQGIDLAIDEIRAIEVLDVRVDKYNIQLKYTIESYGGVLKKFAYFKPVWPDELTISIDKAQYPFLTQSPEVYAKFDDTTILCFTLKKSKLQSFANRFVSFMSASDALRHTHAPS